MWWSAAIRRVDCAVRMHVEPVGGLPRRGTYVAELRKKGEAALVDAGGAPGGDSEYQKLKFEALLVGTKQMGLRRTMLARRRRGWADVPS